MTSIAARTASLVATIALGCATGPAPKAVATARAAPPPEPQLQVRRVESKGALKLAATELSCDLEQVRVWDKGDYVRAHGCGKVAYFVKVTPKQWERAGALVEIPEPDREVDLDSLEGATRPEVLYRAEPAPLAIDKWKQIHAWQPVAQADCIVRVDGTLGYCNIFTAEPSISDAVGQALTRYKFRPATYQGRPVPADYVVTLKINVQRPNCYGLSSPMARAQCETVLKEIHDRIGD